MISIIKDVLKNIVFSLEIIFFSPLLILFGLTKEKELIIADVRRWLQTFSWSYSDLIGLLVLNIRQKEFRNLYYFRMSKGSLLNRVFLSLIKVFYKECPYLFIDASCNIGSGLFIQHGFSTIIMADIGENCWINQQVTIGYKDKTGRPKIGNNVRITAGAKVLGNIIIGDNVTVGANAVVVKNIPDNCVVVGIPAYIVKKDGVKVKEELV